MSEQDRIAFEKKCYPSGLGLSKNNTPDSDLDGYQDAYVQHAWNAWQAATAEANKRIEALEGEVAELKEQLSILKPHPLCDTSCLLSCSMEADYAEKQYLENQQLQASNNNLRSVLINALEGLAWADGHINSDLIKGKIARIQKMLFSTPAESLQAFENEVIEKCAKVCDGENSFYSHSHLASKIRSLKEVK